MSNESSGAAPSPSEHSAPLQFDRAIPVDPSASPATTCLTCGRTIDAPYYSVNARTCCADCTAQVRAHFQAPDAVQLARAALFGLGAAALGTAIYYGVLAISGIEFGIIAIVVGLMVGKAVQRGGEARGGWKLQAMAMLLTYCSIVASYLPMIFAEAKFSEIPVAAAVILVLLVPFLQGMEGIIGLIIIAIGLYEAWKINKRPRLEITGPHAVPA